MQYFLNNLRIIGSIGNATTAPGCTSMSIENSGTSWSSFFSGQRSEKIWRITAENPTAPFQVSFYMTSAELDGRSPLGLNIVGTTATSISSVSSMNTTVYSTTSQPFGTGYVFTSNVQGDGLFFLSNAFVTGLPQIITENRSVQLLENPAGSNLRLYFSNFELGTSDVYLRTLNSTGQLLETWKISVRAGQVVLPLKTQYYGNGGL